MKKDQKSRIIAFAVTVSLLAAGCGQKVNEEIVLPTLEATTTTAPEETAAPDAEETDAYSEMTTAVAETSVTEEPTESESVFGDFEYEVEPVYSENMEINGLSETERLEFENSVAARPWNETTTSGTFYVTEDCYSRERAVYGSTPVASHTAGETVTVVAITDSNYYKLSDGSYIAVDYVSSNPPAETAAEVTLITTAETQPPETEVKPRKTKPAETEPDLNETYPPVTDYDPFYTNEQPSAPQSVEVKEPTDTIVTNGKYKIDFSKRYAYKQLKSMEERFLYASIVDAAQHLYIGVDIPAGISEEDAIRVYATVLNAEPELFWLSGSISASSSGGRLRLRYITYDEAEIAQKQKEIDSKAKAVLDKVAGQSTVVKLRYFHDYIVTSNAFSKDTAGYNSSIYNGLTGKDHLQCAGYAKTFSYLCDMSGIESITVVGTNGDGASHAWDVVNVDGEYYNVDTTWDDPTKSGEVDRGPKYARYDYFLVPDKWLLIDHFNVNKVTLSSGTVHLFKPPAATATDKNYFSVYGLVYSDKASAKAALEKQIDDAVSKKNEVVEIRVTSKEIWDSLMDKSTWSDLQKRAKGKSSKVSAVKRLGADNAYSQATYIVHYDIEY